MGIIDWNSVWDLQMLVTDRARLNDGAFWDRVAKDEKSGRFTEELTDFQLECLDIKETESVLEIGPGRGRLTKELAKRSSSLTVLDPSEIMLEELAKSLEDDGLNGIRMINSKLEDIPQDELGSYDVVVASYSLFMMDMETQLRKMTDASKDRVCIFVPANLRIPEKVQHIIKDTRSDIQIPDHVVLFNLLWDMGIKADVLVRSYVVKRGFDDFDSALDEQMRFHNVPEEKRTRMEEYVSSILSEEDGSFVWEQERSTALLRWRRA